VSKDKHTIGYIFLF